MDTLSFDDVEPVIEEYLTNNNVFSFPAPRGNAESTSSNRQVSMSVLQTL